MSWVRLEPAMWDNPKVQQLGDKAYRAYVQSILWTAHFRTDGVLPARDLPDIVGRRKWRTVVAELAQAGLIHGPGESCDSCDQLRSNREIRPLESADSQIHEYLSFNPSNREIQRRHERDRSYKKRRSEPPPTPDGSGDVPIGSSDRKNEPDKAERTRGHTRIVSNYPLTNVGNSPPRTVTDTRETGGNDPSGTFEELVSAVTAIRPYWSPFAVVDAAKACAAAGRTQSETLSALLRVAADPRTTYPSRVVADGPWWRPVVGEGEFESKSDQRVRRTIALGEQIERQALERRATLRALDGGAPECQ